MHRSHPYFVSEYFPGTLADVMRAKVGLIQKISFAVQLLSALAHISSRPSPIVHRDLKPKNIFVKNGSCIIGDLGLFKRLIEPEVDRDFFVNSFGRRMAFYYRTPDLVAYVDQGVDLTIKADIIQLGLVLAELFTGRSPSPAREEDAAAIPRPVRALPGLLGAKISELLSDLLLISAADRPNASLALEQWRLLLSEAIKATSELGIAAF